MRGLGDRYADHVDRLDDKRKHRLRVAVYLQPKNRFERALRRLFSTLLVVTGLVGDLVGWRWWSVLLAAELAVGAGVWLFSRRRWTAAEKALTERGDGRDAAPGFCDQFPVGLRYRDGHDGVAARAGLVLGPVRAVVGGQ